MPFNQEATKYGRVNSAFFQMDADGEGKNWSLSPFKGMLPAWADDSGNLVIHSPSYPCRLVQVDRWFNSKEDCNNYNFFFVGAEWNKEMDQSFWESGEFSVKKFKWGKLSSEKQYRNVVEWLVLDTTIKPSERLAVKLWLAREGVLEIDA